MPKPTRYEREQAAKAAASGAATAAAREKHLVNTLTPAQLAAVKHREKKMVEAAVAYGKRVASGAVKPLKPGETAERGRMLGIANAKGPKAGRVAYAGPGGLEDQIYKEAGFGGGRRRTMRRRSMRRRTMRSRK